MPFERTSSTQTSNAAALDQPALDRSSRDRRSVAGMSYSEGQAALSPRTADQNEAARQAKAQERFEKLLGETLGGKLYGLVVEHFSADKVTKYGIDGLDAVAGSLADLVKPIDGFQAMDEKSEADAVKAFAQALAKWAAEEGKDWLKSDEGQAFAKDIGQWFEGRPLVVVSMALAAAVGAYASDMSIPELKQRFKLGANLSGTASVDLGSLQSIALNGAKTNLEWNQNGIKAGLKYDYKSGQDGTQDLHQVGASIGIDRNGRAVSAESLVGSDGSLLLKTDASLSRDFERVGMGLSYAEAANGSTTTLGNVSLRLGTEENNVTSAAKYDFGTGILTLDTASLRTYDWGQLQTRAGGSTDGSMNLGASALVGNKDALKMALDLRLHEIKGDNLETSMSKTWGDGRYSLGASANYNLSDQELTAVGMRFGYRDPNEFKSVLLDYKRSIGGDIPDDRVHLMIEHSLHDWMFRIQNTTSLRDGALMQNIAQAHAARPLGDDWTFVVGGRYGHQSDQFSDLADRDRGAWLETGLQYKKVPLIIGYRPEDNAVSFGVTIPFGR